MKWPASTDEQAMQLVQSRADHAAFAQLVRRWEGPVRRLCIRMTGDEHRGEDLAQEAFAKVFANRQQYVPGKKFSTWLWRIALNVCFEEGRRTRGRGEVEIGDDAAVEEVGPVEKASAGERVAMVRAALAKLPQTHRVVVVLREYENMTCREIAEVLEIPEGTVKWRMADALTKLSHHLRVLSDDESEANQNEPPTRSAVDGIPVRRD
jgi:RNA polymerase sigma-70 factor (ECF subfamily)